MKTIYKIAVIGMLTTLSAGIILSLQAVSEKRLHAANNFTRIFAPKAVLDKELKLKNKSFYFAGHGPRQLYLGNYTEPLQTYLVDMELHNSRAASIELKEKNLPFRTVRITVRPPYFYVVDNTIPALFTGQINDWSATLKWRGTTPILRHQVVDTCTLNFTRINDNGQTVLGSLSFCGTVSEGLRNDLLKGQQDGLFDVDGVLLYDGYTDRTAYVYHYRNQYIIADKTLKKHFSGATIDTNSIAKIKVKHLEKQSQKKLADQGLVVNSSSVFYKGVLFIKSALRSKYEPQDVWERATVIDTYDVTNGHYITSFYIYDIDGEKPGSFYIVGNKLYAIAGSSLLKYSLSVDITKFYQDTNEILAVSGEGRKPVKE